MHLFQFKILHPKVILIGDKSIPEINQQLYVKYHLTDEEIAFIEKMIKPM